MANVSVTITGDKEIFKKINRIVVSSKQRSRSALSDIANEILRLSQQQVPHDVGSLQNSGNVLPFGNDGYIIGYHEPYAARLHEHPEYNFQKGRKGKYLEDPVRMNLEKFKLKYKDEIEELIKEQSK